MHIAKKIKRKKLVEPMTLIKNKKMTQEPLKLIVNIKSKPKKKGI